MIHLPLPIWLVLLHYTSWGVGCLPFKGTIQGKWVLIAGWWTSKDKKYKTFFDLYRSILKVSEHCTHWWIGVFFSLEDTLENTTLVTTCLFSISITRSRKCIVLLWLSYASLIFLLLLFNFSKNSLRLVSSLAQKPFWRWANTALFGGLVFFFSGGHIGEYCCSWVECHGHL